MIVSTRSTFGLPNAAGYTSLVLQAPTASADGTIYYYIDGLTPLTVNKSTVAVSGALTVSGNATVTDEAYGAGWNGSTQVPTKNALYDKIETLGAGGSGDVVLSATQTFTGANTFQSSTTFNGYVEYNNVSTMSFTAGTTVQFSGGFLDGTGYGTSGQVWTSNGSGQAPTWQDAAGGTSNFSYVFPLGQMKIGAGASAVIENSTSSIFGPLLLFDDTTVEYSSFTTTINGTWGTPKADLIYSMRSATSGDIEMGISLMCVSPDDSADVDAASYAAEATGTETVPGTAGYSGKLTITLTDDSCANGDLIALALRRITTSANDDASGDLELRSLRVYAQ